MPMAAEGWREWPVLGSFRAGGMEGWLLDSAKENVIKMVLKRRTKNQDELYGNVDIVFL